MTKKELYEKLIDIDQMTWHYPDKEREMWDYSYEKLANMLKNASEDKLESVGETYDAVKKILPYKYGYEHKLLTVIPDLKQLVDKIDSFELDKDEHTINAFIDLISNTINTYFSSVSQLDFLQNPYTDVDGKEGLCLSLESLKSIAENPEYLKFFPDKSKFDVLVDYVEIIDTFEGKIGDSKSHIEEKYTEGLKNIWRQSLSDNFFDKPEKFQALFSTISGYNIEQAINLINRQEQQSCSLITNNEMAIYGGFYNKVGFIYPSDSTILCAGSSDLYSNVFGNGLKNREKASYLATPLALEKQTIDRIDKKHEDRYHTELYNEVLVNSKPCAICAITMGERELNKSYVEGKKIASKLGLPFVDINMLEYKKDLSEEDMKYITYHYYVTKNDIDVTNLPSEDFKEMQNYIDNNKQQIFSTYINLLKSGTYTPQNFIDAVSRNTGEARN